MRSRRFYGGMAEWFKAAVLKTVDPRGSVGSNPTPSANKIASRFYMKRFGIFQKCLHGLMKRFLKGWLIRERAGAFSAVTGGRALSFDHLSMGEAAAPSLSRGMRRGQNSPVDKWSEKTSPGALGTQEKVPVLSRHDSPCKRF
jgi:hypothetical protein